MELLGQVSNHNLLFSAAAVTVVLICAALVFVFGFHSAEQPQFDKLPLIVDDRKSKDKKKKSKDKKSSPNRVANEDGKSKSDSSKKSPAKEKKEEKAKEAEKPKAEPKVVKKEAPAPKAKKGKLAGAVEKPADFDEGVWEEVPKKERKEKKVKPDEDGDKAQKKDSPARKPKKVGQTKNEVEVTKEQSSPEKPKVIVNQGPILDEESARKLQEQVEEFQRVMKEAERRDKAALGDVVDEAPMEDEEVPEVKDLRSNRVLENKEKEKKKAEYKPKPEKDSPEPEKQESNESTLAFNELGDTWTDAKAPKKGKKKARKDQ